MNALALARFVAGMGSRLVETPVPAIVETLPAAPRITVSKETQFDTGHRVPGHRSKCRHPHGHRYRVRATCVGEIVTTPGAPDEGMLVDFGDLKTMLTQLVHDRFDHAFVVHADDVAMRTALSYGDPDWKVVVFDAVPTAENLARWIADTLDVAITERYLGQLALTRVDVWETPTSVATVELPA